MKKVFKPRAARIANTSSKRWNSFRDKKLKSIHDEISLVVVTHLFIEMLMNEFLSLVLVNGSALEKERFSTKLNVLEATGCLPNAGVDIAGGIRQVNKIRNKFAHNLDYRLTRADISAFPGIKSRGKTNINRFRYYTTYIIGYLTAFKDVWELSPYIMTIKLQHSLFKNDSGFDLKKIQEEYRKNHEEDLLSAIESMKRSNTVRRSTNTQ